MLAQSSHWPLSLRVHMLVIKPRNVSVTLTGSESAQPTKGVDSGSFFHCLIYCWALKLVRRARSPQQGKMHPSRDLPEAG